MKKVMTNGFVEISEMDLALVEGGKKPINWGDVGYGGTERWNNFWEGVGAGAYDAAHGWYNFWEGVGASAYDYFH